MLVTAFFLFTNGDYSDLIKVGFLAWIVWTTIKLGMLFESHSKILLVSEILRLVLLPISFWGIIQFGFEIPLWTIFITSTYSVISILAVMWIINKR